MEPLRLRSADRIVFLTGAGISVASGLRPYRGPGGLWEEVDVRAWATADAAARDPHACFRAFHDLARAAAAAAPNAAHRALAAFAAPRAAPVPLITQNIDGLHQRASSQGVIEIHGSLARLRCPERACGARIPAPPLSAEASPAAPPCPRCGAPLRYDVVLFEEPLDPADERAAKQALRECDVLIAVGTSCVVYPAAGFFREADYAGARTVLVNLEPPSPPNPYVHEVHLGRAEEILPRLLGLS